MKAAPNPIDVMQRAVVAMTEAMDRAERAEAEADRLRGLLAGRVVESMAVNPAKDWNLALQQDLQEGTHGMG